MKHKNGKRQVYDSQFMRSIIDEYLITGSTKKAILVKYNIRSHTAIERWMEKLGYNDHYREKVKKFAAINTPMATNNQSEDIRNLQSRIKLLEKQLAEEKLRSEAYARVIEIAENELKIPLRKKINTK
jgi:transposase